MENSAKMENKTNVVRTQSPEVVQKRKNPLGIIRSIQEYKRMWSRFRSMKSEDPYYKFYEETITKGVRKTNRQKPKNKKSRKVAKMSRRINRHTKKRTKRSRQQ